MKSQTNVIQMQPTMQKAKDGFWKDDKGTDIPYNRITKLERLKEKSAGKLYKQALQVHERLQKYKDEMRQLCYEVYDLAMDSYDGNKDSKGNFTWYNFDRTIKVKVKIQDRIEFDDLGIKACKDKLHTFIQENVQSKNDFIKQLVLDAFETTRGKLDTKKVLSLLRYRSKIDDKLFQDAMALLEDAIRHPDSKEYFQIWVRDNSGEYQNIELNFSSIK